MERFIYQTKTEEPLSQGILCQWYIGMRSKTERFFYQTKTEPAFEPGSMPVLTATGSWLFDFQPSDACRLAKLRLQETCDTPKERR